MLKEILKKINYESPKTEFLIAFSGPKNQRYFRRRSADLQQTHGHQSRERDSFPQFFANSIANSDLPKKIMSEFLTSTLSQTSIPTSGSKSNTNGISNCVVCHCSLLQNHEISATRNDDQPNPNDNLMCERCMTSRKEDAQNTSRLNQATTSRRASRQQHVSKTAKAAKFTMVRPNFPAPQTTRPTKKTKFSSNLNLSTL
jgi:hypothetical protein